MTRLRAHNRRVKLHRGTRLRPVTVKEPRESVSDVRKEEILRILARQPERADEISHDIEVPAPRVRILLNELECEGKVVSSGRPALWSLTS